MIIKAYKVNYTILYLLVILLVSSSVYLSAETKPSGDEVFYFRNSSIIAKYIFSFFQEEQITFQEAVDSVLGRGWFMPGMSIILTPLQLIYSGNAPVTHARLYIILLNICLVVSIINLLLSRGVSVNRIIIVLLILNFSPYYLFYLGMFWGDLISAHIIIYLFLYADYKLEINKHKTHIKSLMLISLLLSIAFFIRPQYIFLIFVILLLFFLKKLNPMISFTNKNKKTIILDSLLMLSIPFLALLLWHTGLYSKFGTTFMITSINTSSLFQNKEYTSIATNELNIRNNYIAVYEKLKKDSYMMGRTFQEQVSIEKERFKNNTSQEFNLLHINIKKYFFSENYFLNRFFQLQTNPIKFSVEFKRTLYLINSYIWYFILALGSFTFFIPLKVINDQSYILPYLYKSVFFLITIQPIIFDGMHGRYYIALIPIIMFLSIPFWKKHDSLGLSMKCHHDIIISLGQLISLLFIISYIAYYLLTLVIY